MATSTVDFAANLQAAQQKMRNAQVDEVAIGVFSHYFRELQSGATGLLPEALIEPVTMDRLSEVNVDPDAGAEALATTAVIKLNGGLGTSMGMDQAKSLLPVKAGLSFLDVTVRQVLALRQAHGVRLPLIFMNSFRTSADTLAAIASYDELPVAGLPVEFLQNKEPKLTAAELAPVEYPAEPELEWCPPGHGDIYTALYGTGLVAQLLEAGYERVFISNSDNLGAVADPRMAGWFAQSGAPYAMEAVVRTPSDRKSGHFARRRSDGRLVLREFSQCPREDAHYLQDLDRHRHCNTNNIWIDLTRLHKLLVANDGVLGLPLIRNLKTVDPAKPDTTPVVQIETAMGAAVEAFDGAQLIEVGRDRFVPVKTTNDLLVLRSDSYSLTEAAILEQVAAELPFVDLATPYKLVPDFDARFRQGPPSLREATSLRVLGDWQFGADVVVRGAVELDAGGGVIADGTVLETETSLAASTLAGSAQAGSAQAGGVAGDDGSAGASR